MTAFLETRLLVVTADTAGRKMLPWRSRENYLTLKRCWDKLTVEEKQNCPGSVAAAASPAETQVTHAGCSRLSGPTGHAPEAAGWKFPKDTLLNEAPVHRAFSQGPQGPRPSLHGCGPATTLAANCPQMGLQPPSAQHCARADAVVFKVLLTGDASPAKFRVISQWAQEGPNRTTVCTGQLGH